MRYYIIAGEASGDLHGANLIAGLKKSDPNSEFRFWGGDRMVNETCEECLVKHYKAASFFGFVQIVLNLKTILGQIKECQRDIIVYNPDVVILIDYPGFNFKIAKFAHQRGFKTFYYIAPKVWAWKESRVKLIKKYVSQLFVIFPFEIEYFKGHGIDAIYEGNPIMDEIEIQKRTMQSKEEFCRDNNLDVDRPIIALLAGSRKSEIQNNLPFMAQVSERFKGYQFVVGGVSWLDKSIYDAVLEGTSIKFVSNQTYPLIHHATAAIVTSGTATLETAILGAPEVVCYRGDAISIYIARKLVKIRFISLVNIVMDREVVKELIQEDMTVDNATNELMAILPGGAKHEAMNKDFEQLRGMLGDCRASERVANRMYAILKENQKEE